MYTHGVLCTGFLFNLVVVVVYNVCTKWNVKSSSWLIWTWTQFCNRIFLFSYWLHSFCVYVYRIIEHLFCGLAFILSSLFLSHSSTSVPNHLLVKIYFTKSTTQITATVMFFNAAIFSFYNIFTVRMTKLVSPIDSAYTDSNAFWARSNRYYFFFFSLFILSTWWIDNRKK